LLKNRRTLGLGEALFEGMTYGRLDDLMTYWRNLCWGFHVDVEIPKVSSIISWQITKQGMIQHSRSSVVYELIW
jgi:hypothetical protein